MIIDRKDIYINWFWTYFGYFKRNMNYTWCFLRFHILQILYIWKGKITYCFSSSRSIELELCHSHYTFFLKLPFLNLLSLSWDYHSFFFGISVLLCPGDITSLTVFASLPLYVLLICLFHTTFLLRTHSSMSTALICGCSHSFICHIRSCCNQASFVLYNKVFLHDGC